MARSFMWWLKLPVTLLCDEILQRVFNAISTNMSVSQGHQVETGHSSSSREIACTGRCRAEN